MDRKVTVSDIVMMKLVIAAGGPDNIAGCSTLAADVDKNDIYSVADIVELKRIIANSAAA